jgi:hypothetical protein
MPADAPVTTATPTDADDLTAAEEVPIPRMACNRDATR